MELEHFRYFLYGLLILGSIKQGFAKPTSGDVSATAENEDGMQNDYNEPNDYSDDDTGSVPDSLPTVTTQKTEPTELPYFDQKEYIKQAKPGDNITLECPVKNFGASNVILWYKEDHVIVSGTKNIGDQYHLDDANHSLSISNITEKDSGNYYCEVLPKKVRVHVNVQISELSNHAAEAQSNSDVLRSMLLTPSICVLVITVFLRI